jgi:membrane-anchored mycosin MYCP
VRRLRPALLGAACGGLLGLAPVSPALAADPVCDSTGTVLESDVDPLDQLGIGRAQTLAGRPTTPPVRVAVLDSGVTGPWIPVVERHTAHGGGEVRFFHGTAVAGLIAGDDLGVAPDAEIVDVRVYDTDGTSDDGVRVTEEAVADGLFWVAQQADDLNIRVANVSLVVRDSPRLERAVRAAREAGVIVVAASGNRPGDGDEFAEDFEDGGPGPGEDAAGTMFPTGFGWPLVVSASATAARSGETDPTPHIVLNSATTVAAPTFGARTYGLDGRRCALGSIATSWAAAEVSGVLALLAQRYPQDTDEQLVARLVNTANGTPDDPTPLTGAGVVQPVEALTRPLDPDRSGDLGRTVSTARDTAPAVAPEPEADPLAGAGDDAVWWGLIGGGVLVVALLLRPVLARRRT